MAGLGAATSVGAGDDFEQVAVGVIEVHTSLVIPIVDVSWLSLKVSDQLAEVSFMNTGEILSNSPSVTQEREVQLRDIGLGTNIDGVKRGIAANPEDRELVAEDHGMAEREQFGVQHRGCLLVTAGHDVVVQYGHPFPRFWSRDIAIHTHRRRLCLSNS
jgi:hypothetical protein